MNKTVSRFIASQNIDLAKISKLEEKKIFSSEDINSITHMFYFMKSSYRPTRICITDIKGYNYKYINLGNTNVIENMPYFFDEEKLSYPSRSVSLLDIPTEKIIKELERSFKDDPICLAEADRGAYTISTNGMHRYHVIKAHYLKELSALTRDDLEGLQKLKNKYTFEVLLSEVDLLKSYSSYLLHLIACFQHKNIDISAVYPDSGGVSPDINVCEGEEMQIMNDQQLIGLLQNNLKNFLLDKNISKKQFKEFFKEIDDAKSQYSSFNDFITQNLKEFTPYLSLKNMKHFGREDEYANL